MPKRSSEILVVPSSSTESQEHHQFNNIKNQISISDNEVRIIGETKPNKENRNKQDFTHNNNKKKKTRAQVPKNPNITGPEKENKNKKKKGDPNTKMKKKQEPNSNGTATIKGDKEKDSKTNNVKQECNGNNDQKKSKGKRKRDDDEDEEDDKSESALYKFPHNRIHRIIKSENNDIRMSQEAIFLVNKATEKFLEVFSREAFACSFLDRKNYVAYDHLSSVVSKRQRFDFLSDFVPQRVRAEDALAELSKAEET